MRRAHLVLILGISGVVAGLVYGTGLDRFSSILAEPLAGKAELGSVEAIASQQTASLASERNESTPVATTNDQLHRFAENHVRMRTDVTDENARRKEVRKDAAREVPELYSHLLEDLNLTPKHKNDLISLLIEFQVAATTRLDVDDQSPRTATLVLRGKPIDEKERSQKIAAIIGEEKLRQFLTLERNLSAYSEVKTIASVLNANGVPLTEVQRDQLLDRLVQTRNQYMTTPFADVTSIEDLERIVAERDEYERHVVELAPSVLSPSQVPYVFEQYQYQSELRARNLQLQRKMQEKWRAEHPTENPVLLYPDG